MSEMERNNQVGQVIAFLRTETDREKIKSFLSELHSADIAEALYDLPQETRQMVLELLDVETAAEVLDEIGEEETKSFLKVAPVEVVAMIVDEMPADEAADVFEHTDEDKVKKVLDRIDPEHASNIKEALGYKPETAGGLMTAEYFTSGPKETASQIISRIRGEYKEMETVNEIFVCSDTEKLLGVIKVGELIASKPDQTADKIMEKASVTVVPEADQEFCAQLMQKYDLDVLPVVDNRNHILGIITVDDILDVIEEETSEDMYRLAGIGDDNPLEHGPFKKAFGRLPWLIITLIGMSLLGFIMSRFHLTIEKFVAVSFFIPAIMGLGGNVGIQCSTLTVRGLATGEIDFKDYWWLLRRELTVAFIIGVVCASVLGIVAYIMLRTNPEAAAAEASSLRFGLVVGAAMMVGILSSVVLGTTVPMVCHKMKVDPAIASGPFVTTLIDIGTQSIYLSLATWILIM